jgi:phage/plasmid-like protein (TIGR03299 family)
MARTNRSFGLDAKDNTAAELAAMIYGGAKPWHGCGQAVPEGMDWQNVPTLDPIGYSDRELRPMQVPAFVGGFKMVDVPGSVAVMRKADDKILGVVGDKYGLIQPRDVIQAMADVANVAGAKLTTAGFLKGGNVQWAQAKVPGLDFTIPIGAKANPASVLVENLSMFNSFDGTLQFMAGGAATDIVCQNTYMHALGQTKEAGKRTFKIRHTSGAKLALDSVVREMQAMRDGFNSFAEMAIKLAETSMSVADFGDFALALVPDPIDGKTGKAEAKRASLLDAFLNAPGQKLDGKRNTAWGAASAVTFWTTWAAPVRAEDKTAARWYSATLGDGADLADQAFQTLRVIAGL